MSFRVRKVHPDRADIKDRLGCREKMGRVVIVDLKARLVTRGRRVHVVKWVNLDRQELLVHQEYLVQKGHLEKTDHEVHQGFKDFG